MKALLFDFKVYAVDLTGKTLTARYYQTDYEADLTGIPGFDGVTWTSTAIQMGKRSHNAEKTDGQLPITAAKNHPVALPYLTGSPLGERWISVYSWDGSILTPEWKGEILSAEWKGAEVEMTADWLPGRLARKGLGLEYRPTCLKVLYSDSTTTRAQYACGASRSANTRAGTVTSISTDGKTLTTTLGESNDWFTNGTVYAAGQARSCIGYTAAGGVIKLRAAIDGLTVGAALTAEAGCARTRAVCKAKFNNVINFGGHDTVPTDNYFTTGLV